MEYLKIDTVDFSRLVNSIKVNTQAKYNAQTNANGDTVVDLINMKKTVEVGFIPMYEADMESLLSSTIGSFEVDLEYYEAENKGLINIHCIIPESNIEYYTIRDNNVMLNGCNMTFIEL